MEAPALRCRSCGGPVRSGDVRCPSCDSQVATVACPGCFALVALDAVHCPKCGAAVARPTLEEAGPLACPGCLEPLQREDLGGTRLAQCLRCGGTWLARPAFEHLVEAREERASFLDALPAAGGPPAPGAVTYRPCPACGRLMNRNNYARVSGVIVDTCRDHGLWFDADELRRVLAFIEAGGLKRAAQHDLAELQAERDRLREAQAEARAADGTAGFGTVRASQVDSSGLGPLLGEILAGAAATLWHQLRR